MIEMKLKGCPVKVSCPIDFKDIFICYTERRLNCVEFKRLCKMEWDKVVEQNRKKIRNLISSYNLYFTNLYFIIL